MTHIENSVETTTSVDHDETDVEEKEKIDLRVTGKENTSEPTEDAKKLCTFDIRENEEKGDEFKSKEAKVTEGKRGAKYETERPTFSELSSDETKRESYGKTYR